MLSRTWLTVLAMKGAHGGKWPMKVPWVLNVRPNLKEIDQIGLYRARLVLMSVSFVFCINSVACCGVIVDTTLHKGNCCAGVSTGACAVCQMSIMMTKHPRLTFEMTFCG